MSNVITLRHGSHGIIDAQQLGTSQAIMTYKSLIAQKLELPRTKITQIDSEFVEWLEADMESNSPQKILQKLIELIRKYRTLGIDSSTMVIFIDTIHSLPIGKSMDFKKYIFYTICESKTLESIDIHTGAFIIDGLRALSLEEGERLLLDLERKD